MCTMGTSDGNGWAPGLHDGGRNQGLNAYLLARDRVLPPYIIMTSSTKAANGARRHPRDALRRYAKSFDLRTAEAADHPRKLGSAEGPREALPAAHSRILHWSIAVMALAMRFIGIGMVSTLRPRFLTLISMHKALGIAVESRP